MEKIKEMLKFIVETLMFCLFIYFIINNCNIFFSVCNRVYMHGKYINISENIYVRDTVAEEKWKEKEKDSDISYLDKYINLIDIDKEKHIDKIMDMFKKDGGSIILLTTRIEEYKEGEINAIGDYQHVFKTIRIVHPNIYYSLSENVVLQHELGHYIDNKYHNLSKTKAWKNIYNLNFERGFSDLFDSYSSKNEEEFFAESFAHYISNNITTLDVEITQYFDELLNEILDDY